MDIIVTNDYGQRYHLIPASEPKSSGEAVVTIPMGPAFMPGSKTGAVRFWSITTGAELLVPFSYTIPPITITIANKGITRTPSATMVCHKIAGELKWGTTPCYAGGFLVGVLDLYTRSAYLTDLTDVNGVWEAEICATKDTSRGLIAYANGSLYSDGTRADKYVVASETLNLTFGVVPPPETLWEKAISLVEASTPLILVVRD